MSTTNEATTPNRGVVHALASWRRGKQTRRADRNARWAALAAAARGREADGYSTDAGQPRP
jgi:hypothetical protein